MKKTLLLSVSLALAGAAQAQLVTISGNATTPGIVAASETKLYMGTTATNAVIDCRGQQNVAVQVTFAHMGAGTDACGFAFTPQVDTATTNVHGSTAFYIVGAAAGTTGTSLSTNCNVKGYPYLRLAYITNGVAEVMTNISIKYWVKRNAP